MRKSTRILIVLFVILVMLSCYVQPVAAADETSGLLDAMVSGGPIAVLAFIIWLQARADGKNNREQWQQTCGELMELKKDDIRSRDENTKALQQLTDMLGTGRSPPR
jgi:hypothetical protein